WLSDSCSSASRLTTTYSTRNGLLKPRAFGVRRCSGVWPPSNRGLMLLRAPWPLLPRPAVLPPLPAMPRPTRRRAVLAPGAGFRSWIFMSGDLFHTDEMRHASDHPADLGPVGVLDGVVDPPQAERAERAPLLRLAADRRPHLGDLQGGHAHATSV